MGVTGDENVYLHFEFIAFLPTPAPPHKHARILEQGEDSGGDGDGNWANSSEAREPDTPVSVNVGR